MPLPELYVDWQRVPVENFGEISVSGTGLRIVADSSPG